MPDTPQRPRGPLTRAGCPLTERPPAEGFPSSQLLGRALDPETLARNANGVFGLDLEDDE